MTHAGLFGVLVDFVSRWLNLLVVNFFLKVMKLKAICTVTCNRVS